MTTRPKLGQRVAYGPPPHDERSFLGVVIEPGDEQSIVGWDNGNETCALNKWLTFLPDAPIKDKALLRAMKRQAGVVTGRLEGGAHIEEVPKPERKPAPDDLPERLKPYDAEQLRKFAVANGVWQDKYATLPNPGLVRMNVVNRLRAKIKHGHKVVWK